MAEILNVGFDSALLTTRRIMLEGAGHRVEQARDLLQVIAACERTSFNVVILGNSLIPNEKLRVADVVRRQCDGVRLLELHNGVRPDLRDADAHLQALEAGPEELLQVVESLLKKPNRRAAKE
jgi:DNA-binding response OmpR family regulator